MWLELVSSWPLGDKRKKNSQQPKVGSQFFFRSCRQGQQKAIRKSIILDCINNQLQKSSIGADKLKAHDEKVAETAAE